MAQGRAGRTLTQAQISPQQVAREVRQALAAKADPVRACGAERYFKEAVKCYGVAAPEIHALDRDLYARVKTDWTADDAIALCDILFDDPELEAKATAALILGRFKETFPRKLFAKIKEWLSTDRLASWASVDVLCPDSMGAFLQRYPAYVGKIKAWAHHPNRWVKRAALVSFIKLARKPEFLPAVYEISASVFDVDDDLIHKANGWLLREAGKADPARLERFLLARGPSMPRTTVRYAIERFPEAKRKALLARTKPKSPTPRGRKEVR
jgi:3-methyladenine DNA glycosylase AlkD